MKQEKSLFPCLQFKPGSVNLKKRQNIKNCFVNLQKSYLIKIDVEETKSNLKDYHLRCLKTAKR